MYRQACTWSSFTLDRRDVKWTYKAFISKLIIIKVNYTLLKVKVSKFSKWSSVVQHVLLFTDKRKLFLVHLYHGVNHVDSNFLVQNPFYLSVLQIIQLIWSGSNSTIC